MAFFTENPLFEAVYQLAVGDPVLGGPGGTSNIPLQHLTNRTKYLFDQLVALGAGTTAATFSGDLNTFNKNGFFLCRLASLNKPVTDDGMLLNCSIDINPDGGGVRSTLQIFVANGSGNFYWRIISDTVVQAWKEVLSQAAFTAHLDSMVGMVAPFASLPVPSGWFICNGGVVNRTTYSKLFAKIGTTYGVGDGSTTFNLPDLRGQFVRGWDVGRGLDPSRVLGSDQNDQFQEHTHTATTIATSGMNDLAAGSDFPRQVGTKLLNISNAGAGTETRPTNVAMVYCIKY